MIKSSVFSELIYIIQLNTRRNFKFRFTLRTWQPTICTLQNDKIISVIIKKQLSPRAQTEKCSMNKIIFYEEKRKLTTIDVLAPNNDKIERS